MSDDEEWSIKNNNNQLDTNVRFVVVICSGVLQRSPLLLILAGIWAEVLVLKRAFYLAKYLNLLLWVSQDHREMKWWTVLGHIWTKFFKLQSKASTFGETLNQIMCIYIKETEGCISWLETHFPVV